jgi:DNA-binding transcriptional MerR regulator
MQWKVGELAKATGLTVRALHHYDEIGLLEPSARTTGGHRLYDDDDVRRLYRIVALRSLGFGLDQIAEALNGNGGLAETVRLQIARIDDRIAEARELRGRLERVLAATESGSPSAGQMIETIEVMTMHERYYTKEQLDQQAERREALGGDPAMREAEQAWQEIADGLRAAVDAGTDPADPGVQALIDRSDELIAQFTGGDPGIRDSLQRMYESEGAQAASRGMWDAELADYSARARAVRNG